MFTYPGKTKPVPSEHQYRGQHPGISDELLRRQAGLHGDYQRGMGRIKTLVSAGTLIDAIPGAWYLIKSDAPDVETRIILQSEEPNNPNAVEFIGPIKKTPTQDWRMLYIFDDPPSYYYRLFVEGFTGTFSGHGYLTCGDISGSEFAGKSVTWTNYNIVGSGAWVHQSLGPDSEYQADESRPFALNFDGMRGIVLSVESSYGNSAEYVSTVANVSLKRIVLL